MKKMIAACLAALLMANVSFAVSHFQSAPDKEDSAEVASGDTTGNDLHKCPCENSKGKK